MLNEEIWHCDRCEKPCQYEDAENLGIWLSYDLKKAQLGKISHQKAYEKVCDNCGNEFYKLVKTCNKDCKNCPVTRTWGLSVFECLDFQEKYNLISVEAVAEMIKTNSSICSNEFIETFEQFKIQHEVEKLKGMLLTNQPDYEYFAKKAWELRSYFGYENKLKKIKI